MGIDGAGAVSEAELTALALEHRVGEPVAPDAVPWLPGRREADGQFERLPEWYMPPIAGRVKPGWHRVVVYGLVATFAVLEMAGLCSVFGHIVVG